MQQEVMTLPPISNVDSNFEEMAGFLVARGLGEFVLQFKEYGVTSMDDLHEVPDQDLGGIIGMRNDQQETFLTSLIEARRMSRVSFQTDDGQQERSSPKHRRWDQRSSRTASESRDARQAAYLWIG